MEVTGSSSTSLDIYTLHAMLNANDDMPPSEATKFTKDFSFPCTQNITSSSRQTASASQRHGAGFQQARSYLDALVIPPPFVARERDLSYQIGITPRRYLHDDTTVYWTLQQTKQTASGVDFNLHVWFPSACPPEYVHDQVEHLCAEY